MSGENVEQVACKIEECGGLDKIEQLQGHEKTEIYKMAYDIIENYFAGDVCIAYSLPTFTKVGLGSHTLAEKAKVNLLYCVSLPVSGYPLLSCYVGSMFNIVNYLK